MRQTTLLELHAPGYGRDLLRKLPGRTGFGDRTCADAVSTRAGISGADSTDELWAESGVGGSFIRVFPIWSWCGLLRPICQRLGTLDCFRFADHRCQQRN